MILDKEKINFFLFEIQEFFCMKKINVNFEISSLFNIYKEIVFLCCLNVKKNILNLFEVDSKCSCDGKSFGYIILFGQNKKNDNDLIGIISIVVVVIVV